MKRINYFSMRLVLLFGFILFMIQTFGQGINLADAKSVLGNNYVVPAGQYDPGANRDACQYLLDDGTQENSIGFTGDADLFWLNYFTVMPGCGLIQTVSLTWGQMSNGGPCRIILYEDPDDDGNPDDAVFLTETTTTVTNANTNIFTNVSITPTIVNGGFFVAALIQYQPIGEYPSPLDETSYQVNSWIAAAYPGTFDVNNLINNGLPPYLIGDLGFPGNWLLRAEGGPANIDVPLSGWAIGIGMFLILAVALIRLRRF